MSTTASVSRAKVHNRCVYMLDAIEKHIADARERLIERVSGKRWFRRPRTRDEAIAYLKRQTYSMAPIPSLYNMPEAGWHRARSRLLELKELTGMDSGAFSDETMELSPEDAYLLEVQVPKALKT